MQLDARWLMFPSSSWAHCSCPTLSLGSVPQTIPGPGHLCHQNVAAISSEGRIALGEFVVRLLHFRLPAKVAAVGIDGLGAARPQLAAVVGRHAKLVKHDAPDAGEPDGIEQISERRLGRTRFQPLVFGKQNLGQSRGKLPLIATLHPQLINRPLVDHHRLTARP